MSGKAENRVKCYKEGCTNSFVGTRDGRDQAWRDGWYLQKFNGPAWCPNDIPQWIPSSFQRKK